VLEELTIYYIQGLRVQIVLKILYLVESIALRIWEEVVYKDWEYRLCSRYYMRLRIRSASIMQNKCVYKALREIDYKGWELTLKIPYLRRLESTFVMQNKSWQLTAVQPQRDRPSGICKHLYEPARGPYDYKKTPQASVNTFIDPLGEQELATDCPLLL
jgi:hypothetical protein